MTWQTEVEDGADQGELAGGGEIGPWHFVIT
jgi:hypothetical protein